jgi:excisionase family DNA binding protein
METQKYISMELLAVRLNLPQKFLTELVEKGKLPFLKVGKWKRFDIDAVRKALAELQTKGGAK